ncbi:MAG TPA: hypothetical protein DCM87_07900 [Planctomycetes bacterium]|nr:hypothetical protein [Planctomycetota bacterium]
MPRRRLEKAGRDGPPSPRCGVCLRFTAGCICAQLPHGAAGVRVVIIQHAQERKNPSNTGRLVGHVIAGAALLGYGVRGEPFDGRALADPRTDYVVLFPRPGAASVLEALPSARPGRTRAIVLLDATWPKAQRMAQRIAELRALPFARLPENAAPRFALRKPPRQGHLGTAEAAALALELAGEGGAARTLRKALAAVAGEALKERGKTPAAPRTRQSHGGSNAR